MIHFKLRLNNNMPFSELSAEFPGVELYRWCNSAVDYLEFHGDETDLGKVQKALPVVAEKLGSRIEHIAAGKRRLSVMLSCRCSIDNSAIRVIESHNCIWLAPVTYEEGNEKVDVIALDEHKFEPLYDHLKERGQVKILKKSELFPESLKDLYMIPVSSLLGGMTDLQLSYLRKSIEMGYFSSPRRIKIEELAEEEGISKSTMQEHIFKAANILMASMEPYLNLMIEFRSSDRK